MLNRLAAIASPIDSLVITPVDGLGSITVTDAVKVRGEVEVASPGQSSARREREEGEFKIPVASLTRNGVTVLPVAGDLYVATIGGETLTFKVLPRGTQAIFDYCDSGHTRIRVRTKKL